MASKLVVSMDESTAVESVDMTVAEMDSESAVKKVAVEDVSMVVRLDEYRAGVKVSKMVVLMAVW